MNRDPHDFENGDFVDCAEKIIFTILIIALIVLGPIIIGALNAPHI